MTTKKHTTAALLSLALLLPLGVLAQTKAPLFRTSDGCVACHNGLISTRGEDQSFGHSWRPTMMANAARDPYWLGSVQREIGEHAPVGAVIENECARCHMPMASAQAIHEGRMAAVVQHLPARAAATPEALQSFDGVSCALCHQLQAEGLGSPETFSGKFQVDTSTPFGERPIYGPYEIDAGRTRLMHSAAQFKPVQSEHVAQAELCASCHTLTTHSMDAQGQATGELAEQMPYVEWQHSDYGDAQPCQECHMPEVAGSMAISSVLGQPRENVSQHGFRGANFLMPLIFNRNHAALGVAALPQELQASSQRARAFLSESAAALVVDGEVKGPQLEVAVEVSNMAGHKLPTAYPSRRVWLHVTIRDGSGATLLESGALQADGQIAGNDNDADPTRYEPHHAVIDSAEQVQIYEPILGDPAGEVTTGLLFASQYLKDNRIPPVGFEKSEVPEHIQVRGAAAEDADFEGGLDTVRYRVPVGSAGPYQVEAELWYQPIGYRWAHNLEGQASPEARLFLQAYEALAGQSAHRITAASATIAAPAPAPAPAPAATEAETASEG